MALKQGGSIPLQEDIDPDYEPSAEGLLHLNSRSPTVVCYGVKLCNIAADMQRLPTMLSGLVLIWRQKQSSSGFVVRG